MSIEKDLGRIATALEEMLGKPSCKKTVAAPVEEAKISEAPVEVTPVTEEKEKLTNGDVRKAAKELIGRMADGKGMAKAKALIKKHGGADRLADLVPGKYAVVIKALNAVLK